MIIITGCARSYTSLTMRIFDVMGYPVAGNRYIDKKTLGKYNPDGLYEVPNVVVNGLKTDKYQFGAIKLVLGALYPNVYNGHQGTSKSLLLKSKVLFCLRKPIEIAHSATKLMMHPPMAPTYPYYELSGFLSWLSDNRWFMNNIYLFDTDNYFKNAVTTITEIAEFAGITNKEKINNAISCIKEKTRTNMLEWPKKYKKVGDFVDSLYDCLLRNDFNEAFRINNSRINMLTSIR